MDKEKYLDRIKYSGGLEPTLNLLNKLQKYHLLNIPFENLDIHNQIPIKLNIDQFYEKIVVRNRGGFCYELNGLFYELLLLLGFNVKLISAKVYEKDNEYTPEYDHCSIIVKIGNIEYLTDVGFGEFIFRPLELQLREIQNDERGSFLIDYLDNGYLRVNKIENGKSTPQYIFKNVKRELDEYTGMCESHQANPKSHFMKKRLISLPIENGRITISGNTLKVTKNQSITTKELKNETEFVSELWDKFKINIEKSNTNNSNK